jgi:pilus assembly protein CpaB
VAIRLVVVALMLTVATVLGLIAYQVAQPPRVVMAPAPTEPPPPPAATVGYLVAAHARPAGTLARDEDFMVKTVPPGQEPDAALPDTADVRAGLRGALIRRYIDAAAPVTEADVLRPRDRGFLAAVLEPGTRAVSVGVDPVSGVAGLIWPGDRVDVILTQELDASLVPLAKRILSETALSDVRVIAVDQEIVQGASTSAGVAGHLARTVTLQVMPDQAEKLAVAQRLGHLALAIRAASDSPSVAGGASGVGGVGTVFGGDVSPALAHTPAPLGVRMQLIQGGNREEVNFH